MCNTYLIYLSFHLALLSKQLPILLHSIYSVPPPMYLPYAQSSMPAAQLEARTYLKQ